MNADVDNRPSAETPVAETRSEVLLPISQHAKLVTNHAHGHEADITAWYEVQGGRSEVVEIPDFAFEMMRWCEDHHLLKAVFQYRRRDDD